MEVIFMATGKDTFSCRKQLKADGFQWVEDTKAWYGTQSSVDKFKARGFRVKVFFQEVNHNPAFYSLITGESHL